MWGDQTVTHMENAHIWVALHVLFPVHIVVLNHVWRESEAVSTGLGGWAPPPGGHLLLGVTSLWGPPPAGGHFPLGSPPAGGHAPIIFFTISYMACSSSSSFRQRYLRRISSPHRKARPRTEGTPSPTEQGCCHLGVSGTHPSPSQPHTTSPSWAGACAAHL